MERTARTSPPGVIIESHSPLKEPRLAKEVTVVGAGNVGASALRLADRELADVVLVDVIEGIRQSG